MGEREGGREGERHNLMVEGNAARREGGRGRGREREREEAGEREGGREGGGET